LFEAAIAFSNLGYFRILGHGAVPTPLGTPTVSMRALSAGAARRMRLRHGSEQQPVVQTLGEVLERGDLAADCALSFYADRLSIAPS